VEDAAGLDVTVCTPGEVELTVDNTMYRFDVARYGDLRFLDSDTQTIRLVAEPRFPLTGSHEPEGSISAPMPGKVIRVGVRVGDLVDAGQLLVVMEAMKMEHTLRSPSGGRVVQVDCGPGDQVEAGAVLVVVEAV
jgi:biotin carboxyl carrier protein